MTILENKPKPEGVVAMELSDETIRRAIQYWAENVLFRAPVEVTKVTQLTTGPLKGRFEVRFIEHSEAIPDTEVGDD